MRSVILDLQQEALDKSIAVSDLLRKALVIARKLNLREFQAWIEKELNGYDGGDDVPAYRVLAGQVRGKDHNQGWIPVICEDKELEELFSSRKCRQAIAEIEDWIARRDSGSLLYMPLPHAMQIELSRRWGYQTESGFFISSSAMVVAVDAVRTIVLNWALELEADGILGEGLSFTVEERAVAERTIQNVNNFYGTVTKPQIQQGGDHAIQVSAELDLEELRGFLDKLRSELHGLDLAPSDESEINAELTTLNAQASSPKPKRSIIRESLISIRRILEAAGGGATAHLILELGKFLAK